MRVVERFFRYKLCTLYLRSNPTYIGTIYFGCGSFPKKFRMSQRFPNYPNQGYPNQPQNQNMMNPQMQMQSNMMGYSNQQFQQRPMQQPGYSNQGYPNQMNPQANQGFPGMANQPRQYPNQYQNPAQYAPQFGNQQQNQGFPQQGVAPQQAPPQQNTNFDGSMGDTQMSTMMSQPMNMNQQNQVCQYMFDWVYLMFMLKCEMCPSIIVVLTFIIHPSLVSRFLWKMPTHAKSKTNFLENGLP